MTQLYIRPIALAESPQSDEGDAVRLAGGLAYASRFAVIEREDGRIVSRRRFSARELEAALPSLPEAASAQWEHLKRVHPPLQLGERTVQLDQPRIVGILNVTPDSFSDGGKHTDPRVANVRAGIMLEAGAAIVDVGGESTRPGGAQPVWEGDEIERVLPAIGHLAKAGAAISIDTRKGAVMEQALAAGARMINDVSALRYDPRSLELVARAGVPVVLMHAPNGEDLHAEAVYRDVVLDVFDWLAARRDAALAAGIAREHIVLDPGIGFGKNVAENLALMGALPLFHALGQPLMLGASRKRTIGALSNEAPADKRLGGSLMLAVAAMNAGVQLLRVHDVAETVQARDVWRGLRDAALTDFSQLV